MANNRKSIFYPRKEGEVSSYYTNLAQKLAGALGAKYGTDPATIVKINGHKAQIPAKIAKAYADSQISKGSTAEKKAELKAGKTEALRELNRITRLPIWDETDGDGLGIRKGHAAKDLKEMKPLIKSTKSLPDKVIISYPKNGMDGVLVECLEEEPGSGIAKWINIGKDMVSPFEDKRLNKTNKPENRLYRLRYIRNDEAVGLYSEIVHVVAQIYPAPTL